MTRAGSLESRVSIEHLEVGDVEMAFAQSKMAVKRDGGCLRQGDIPKALHTLGTSNSVRGVRVRLRVQFSNDFKSIPENWEKRLPPGEHFFYFSNFLST